MLDDSNKNTHIDIIWGFEQGIDLIDLNGLNFTSIGDGKGATLKTGTVWGNTYLENIDTGFYVVLRKTEIDLQDSDILF